MAENEQVPGNVLIVDDTLANMRLLTQMLREQGYKVRGAPNGEIALNAVRDAPPDVILLDINMPGLNGYDVCRRLKADDGTQHIPIIFLSALDAPFDKVAAFDAGGADYVSKPFQIEEVLARVEHQLRLRRLQEELVESRIAAEAASQAKSAFLANMSHEIRTPMNAILGYSQIMSDDAGLTPLQRKAIDTIESSGEHLLALINDILDLSKIEAGREALHQEPFVVTDLVRDLAALFEMRSQQKGLTWRLEIEVEDSRVMGDAKKLRQTLINLLGNAVKFTDSGEVCLGLHAAGADLYRFEVRDSGPGIPPDRQQLIFEPFQQDESGVQHGGTGLGLAIVRRHLDLMGGSIAVESEEGKGSLFSVTLPLPPAAAATPAASAQVWDSPCRLASGQEVRALVVDDVTTNREIAAHMLEALGVDVNVASSGPDALAVAKAAPGIAFIDIRMPMMSGIELLQELRRQFGTDSFRAVAVSASALEHEQEACLEAGFDRFIGKPLRREQLCACLVELLGCRLELLPESSVRREAPSTQDESPMVLPAAHLEALSKAVRMHNMTGLRTALAAIEADGYADVVGRLRPLGDRYDFKALRTSLEKIREV